MLTSVRFLFSSHSFLDSWTPRHNFPKLLFRSSLSVFIQLLSFDRKLLLCIFVSSCLGRWGMCRRFGSFCSDERLTSFLFLFYLCFFSIYLTCQCLSTSLSFELSICLQMWLSLYWQWLSVCIPLANSYSLEFTATNCITAFFLICAGVNRVLFNEVC